MLGRHTAVIPQEIESSGAEKNTSHKDKVIPYERRDSRYPVHRYHDLGMLTEQ
jgi:hypothetical protein